MKKHKSTTKLMMLSVMLLTVVVIVFSLYLAYETKDTTILSILIPCMFTETATCTAFYFWKRKVEDMILLKQQYGEDFIENTLDDA